MCMCICVCMCRPKADIRYLPWSLSTLYVEARSFESQPLRPVWLGSLLERVPVPTSHTLASQASHQIHEAFVWVLGIQTLACVTQQASPSGTCSPLFLMDGVCLLEVSAPALWDTPSTETQQAHWQSQLLSTGRLQAGWGWIVRSRHLFPVSSVRTLYWLGSLLRSRQSVHYFSKPGLIH